MEQPSKITVAIIQLYAEPLKVEANYQKAEGFIRQAASSGASLAILPEYCLTGWHPKDPSFREAVNDNSYLGRFQDLAKSCNINIVPGTLVEQHKDKDGNDVLYNIAYFISRKGEVLGRYTKKNLWITERDHLTSSGNDTPHDIFQTEYGPCGMLVCWDLAFPEPFRQLVAQGAQLIIIPSYWTAQDAGDYGYSLNPKCEELFINSTVVARAFENAAGTWKPL